MHISTPHRSESGSALVASLATAVILMAFAATMLTTVSSASREYSTDRAAMQRLYLADSGLQCAVLSVSTGGDGIIGSQAAPIRIGAGSYWASSVDNGDNTYTVTAYGEYLGNRRAVRAYVRESGHVFHHAVFAGNGGEDPNYVLDFGGNGTQGDVINGDIYSGGDLRRWGDARITGQVRTLGEATGVAAEEGLAQPIPDFHRFDYANTADVNVVQEFSRHQSLRSAAAGGLAWQVPAHNPAHVFRKNPSDRLTETLSTLKDDYFLEDPYEPVRTDTNQNGTDPYRVTFSDSAPRVIYIDGNLWIHNQRTYSMQISGPGGGLMPARVTLVVRGNVYIADNLFYNDNETTGLAIIALKDPIIPDSGNIYFGDPRFGTLLSMSSFMYAENNFYDNNLDAQGSKKVTLKGTMAAGNKVAISRTYGKQHSKLTVNFDDRLRTGALQLLGLPNQQETLQYEVVAWMEVASQNDGDGDDDDGDDDDDDDDDDK
jgi:hypothetical protein